MNTHSSRASVLAIAISAALAATAVQAQPAAGGSAAGASARTPASGAGAQQAQQGPAADRATDGRAGRLSSTDRRFLIDAIELGAAEVQAAQLALQKGSSEQVRQFAQHMIDDHGRTNPRLMRLASDVGITPPSDTDKNQMKALDRLNKLSGSEFDREYMRMQVDSHQKAVSLYEREAKQGQHPEIRAAAEEVLPALREHLKLARGAQSGKQAGGARSGTSASAGGAGTATGAPTAAPTGSAISRPSSAADANSAMGTVGGVGTAGATSGGMGTAATSGNTPGTSGAAPATRADGAAGAVGGGATQR